VHKLGIPGFDSTRLDRIEELDTHAANGARDTAAFDGAMTAIPRAARNAIARALGVRPLDELARDYHTTPERLLEIARRDGALPTNRRRRWTRADDDLLRACWTKKRPSETARMLRRSVFEVKSRAGELGIVRSLRQWTGAEERFLIANSGVMPLPEIARSLGRTHGAVIGRLKRLGLTTTRTLAPLWKKREDVLLRRLYGTVPTEQIARQLGRSMNSVYARAAALDISRRQWQPWEDAKLRELFDQVPRSEISGLLGRSKQGVDRRITILGLAETGDDPWLGYDRHNDPLLRKLHGKKSPDEITRTLGIGRASLHYHLRRLGLLGRALKPWTDQDDDYLLSAFVDRPYREIADNLGRSIDAIRKRGAILGIERTIAVRDWSEEEDAYLRAHYAGGSIDEIGDALGRSANGVRIRARRLGLTYRG
jgi:hypothetical protein